MDYFIGIDIGTSSVKGIALATNGRLLALTSQSYPVMEDRTGRQEQDPDVICGATFTTLQKLSEAVPSGHQLRGVTFSAAMHGLLAVDAQGKSLAPLITWADTRATEAVEHFRQQHNGTVLYQHTGTPLHPMSPFGKLLWMRDTYPDLFARAFKFVSIKEYLWFQLFDLWEIDHSLASATGLFDIADKSWYGPALSAAFINEGQLSRPVPVTFSRSYVRKSALGGYHLPEGVPYTIGAADGCLANLGSGVVCGNEASLTIGTSAALRIATKEWHPDPRGQLFQYILDDTTYIRGGALNNGGNLLDWFRSVLEQRSSGGRVRTWDLTTLLAEAFSVPPGAEGLLFLPYLHGERAPIWDARASGAFIGLRAHHSRAHLLRAVTEGIGFALNEIFRLLDAEPHSEPIGTVYASGGFTASEAWVQEMANILGKPVCLKGGADASAAGAALLGMVAQQLFPSLEAAAMLIPGGTRYVPDPETGHHYKRCFDLYQTLYPTLKVTLHALDNLF